MADDSKTEKATPKKREDERKKGNTFQSKDIITVVSLLCVFIILKFVFPMIYDYLNRTLVKYINYIQEINYISVKFVGEITLDCIITFFVTTGPVLLTSILTGILASGIQTKFIVSRENLKFKFSRLNPLKGIKNLFSIRSVIELIKSMIKVIIIGYIVFNNFKGLMVKMANMISVNILDGILFIFDSIMAMVFQISLVFVAIAFFDLLYQWWEYEKGIKMSHQDLKEEYKHTEGDPQVKGKIKEIQRQMASKRMMENVPTADVIIKNPTHFAIALKYDIENNVAPVVVAKGQDHMALKIIKIAEENNIPTTEDKPLARALYSAVEVGMEIPPEFYAILAEVMAWVYNLRKNTLKK